MSDADGAGYSPGRLALVAVALLALLLGLTSVANGTPLADAIATLVEVVGYDWVVPAIVGALALLLGLAVFVSGRGAMMRQTEMPAVERPVPVPAAGERFDETIGGWRFATRIFGGETAEEVRDRLRAAAVATIAATEGCSREDARQRVAEGTWTDDEGAAAFLAGEYTPLGTWLVALTSGETGPEYRARRTVAAIRALRDGSARRGSDRDGSELNVRRRDENTSTDGDTDGTQPTREERRDRDGDRAVTGGST